MKELVDWSLCALLLLAILFVVFVEMKFNNTKKQNHFTESDESHFND